MRFDSYHPVINCVYFAALFTFTVLFNHPAFILIVYLAAFLWSVKLNGKKAVIFNLSLWIGLILYTVWYASYHHFGVTNLWQNKIGNWITLESIVYAFVRGVTAVTVIMECSCMFAVVTTDKIIWLLGWISPQISLFFSIVLRFVPRMKKQIQKINTARRGVGRGIDQGNLLQRCRNFLGVSSILITWVIEHLVESAMSMKSRGYSLSGRKAFALYRFDHRDRCFLLGLVCCIMITYIAHVLGESRLLYDPAIIGKPVTSASVFYYLVYAVFAFGPLALQLLGEYRFKQLRKRAYPI